MNINACDVCFADGRKLSPADPVALQVDNQVGLIDLCTECLDELDTILTRFAEAGRIPLTEASRTCIECGHVSDTPKQAAAHRRRHDTARERAKQRKEPLSLTA